MFITIKNLVKEYKLSNNRILKAVDNVDLEIAKGDIYGIMGLSGAGKSTLIRLINRLEEPTEGEIYVEHIETDEKKGENLTVKKNILDFNQNELRDYRKKTGMIFQHFNLLNSRNVGGNIAFPLEISGWKKEDINKRVDELLEIVGLSDKKENYPEQLSGGQKQRTAIARMLIGKSPIMVFDDSLSAVDAETDTKIRKGLMEKGKNSTVIIISHRITTLMAADNILVLDKGRLVESGTHDELIKNTGIYRKIYDIQSVALNYEE